MAIAAKTLNGFYVIYLNAIIWAWIPYLLVVTVILISISLFSIERHRNFRKCLERDECDAN